MPGILGFLPIVERELRVRSRQWQTPWGRVFVAGGATVLALLVLADLGWGSRQGADGVVLFQGLGWLLFWLVIVEGLRLTTSQLSRERREDTLGLLFLTSMRGKEVVWGKLVAAMVQSVYGLMATFPVLGLPLLLGGVRGTAVAKAEVGLVVTLFLVAAVGLWASSRHADDGRALREACLVLVGLGLLLQAPALVSAVVGIGPFGGYSPLQTMSAALGMPFMPGGGSAYGWGLGLQALVGMGFAAAAGANVVTVREGIREAPARGLLRGWREWRARKRRMRGAFRMEDPAAWVWRRSGMRGRMWVAGLAPALWFVPQALLWRRLGAVGGAGWGLMFWGGGMLYEAVVLGWLAAGLVRWVQDARATGAAELLVPTPLGPRGVGEMYWRAMWRAVRLPMLAGAAVMLLIGEATNRGSRLPAGALTLFQVTWLVPHLLQVMAVCAMALHQGLKRRSGGLEVGVVLGALVLVPWLLDEWVGGMLVRALSRFGPNAYVNGEPTLAFYLPFCLPGMLTAAYFGLWWREIRRRYAEGYGRWME